MAVDEAAGHRYQPQHPHRKAFDVKLEQFAFVEVVHGGPKRSNRYRHKLGRLNINPSLYAPRVVVCRPIGEGLYALLTLERNL